MRFLRSVFLWGLLLPVLLVACGGGEGETAVSPAPEPSSSSSSSSPQLSDAYDDALSVQSQLAIGTLQLEETEMAVDEALAAEILPLWRALQSLSNSDTTAEAELTAVLNQIQNTMNPEQIEAIAAMQLTQEALTALVDEGTLVLGRGGFGGNAETGGAAGFTPPLGGLGGGPGGGGGQGQGGIPGGGQGELSEDDIATRQAARESGDFGGFQDRVLMGVVVRLLVEKTGAESEQPADPFAAMWAVLTEATGLTIEEIQTQTAEAAEGVTLTELIIANGGDVESVKADLVASLQESPLAQRQDLDEYVTNLLTNSGKDE